MLGVSVQSIYDREHESAYPRGEQLARLATIRGIGKREAGKRLEALQSATSLIRRKAQKTESAGRVHHGFAAAARGRYVNGLTAKAEMAVRWS